MHEGKIRVHKISSERAGARIRKKAVWEQDVRIPNGKGQI